MAWFGVRFVYEHCRDPDGLTTFGECVTLFEADNDDVLDRKIDAHWSRVVKLNPDFKRLGKITVYGLGKGTPTDGTDVWYELMETRMTSRQFIEARQGQFSFPGISQE